MLRFFFAQPRRLNLPTKSWLSVLGIPNRSYSSDNDVSTVSTAVLFKGLMQMKRAEDFEPQSALFIAQRIAQDICNVKGDDGIVGNHIHLQFSSRLVTWCEDGSESRSVLHSYQQLNFGAVLSVWRKAGWQVVANHEKQQMTIIAPDFGQKPDESTAAQSTAPTPG